MEIFLDGTSGDILMVKLTKIYTRGGDQGQTSLGGGQRVDKHDLRVAAYGEVDEANAAIGIARFHIENEADDMLARIQDDLFDLGADLCTLDETEGALRITPSQVKRLETEIDAINTNLENLASFILPGGTRAAGLLHLARTITRCAERSITKLASCEPINPFAIKYINRLSDHLFVLGRLLNENGQLDVLWRPGANR